MVADIVVDTKQKGNFHNLVNYNSAHSNSISDRIVMPFAFTTNFEQVWCYEIVSHSVKLFMVSRIGKVKLTDTEWRYEKYHKQGYIDIFRFSGQTKYRVKLVMSVRAANLLMEEYPLSRQHLKLVKGNRWVLETDICNYEGITRFILGLYEDIEILKNEELKDFVRSKIVKMRK